MFPSDSSRQKTCLRGQSSVFRAIAYSVLRHSRPAVGHSPGAPSVIPALQVTGAIRPVLVAIVVADGFDLDSEWVIPKCGVVMAGGLREMLRRGDHCAADVIDVGIDGVDQCPAPNDEGQVLQADSLRRVL